MISLDRLVCRAYWEQAMLEGTLGGIHRSQPACRRHKRPKCSMKIIGMLWTGRPCRRRQCWLWRERKRATSPASAPKLRQNRIKCSSLRFKCNSLLYLNRGLPGERSLRFKYSATADQTAGDRRDSVGVLGATERRTALSRPVF
jgi:hypothetical protein